MAIFGRKRGETLTVPSSPLTQTTLEPDQLFNAQEAYAVSAHSSWSMVPPRPRTADGPQQYQSALGKDDYLTPLTGHKHKFRHSFSGLNLSSMTNLLGSDTSENTSGSLAASMRVPEQEAMDGPSLRGMISAKFHDIVTLIDGERFSGDEADLTLSQSQFPVWHQEAEYTSQEVPKEKSKKATKNVKLSLGFSNTNYFSKVYLYTNSRLPQSLPPMKLYLPTFPLLCLAAQYSEQAYEKPSAQEMETLVGADWKTGTKALVVKSAPMDDINTIVFAVRGSQTFMDWVTNINSTPISPEGFLDDPENYCHTGFLTVARKMVAPVAARLRQLIEEFPNRSSYSLLISGHSAGGAVAALLYSHMLSQSRRAESELRILAGCFKRIHCVTFGAPPLSIFPLTKPDNPTLSKSLFLSFLNEGDPITRAHTAYLRSLIDLYSSPAPKSSFAESSNSRKHRYSSGSRSTSSLSVDTIQPRPKKSETAPVSSPSPTWKVPDLLFSNAGRLVLLRGVEKTGGEPSRKKKMQERMDEGVVAQMITDEMLRDVIWGDPVNHMMKLYQRRIEVLATNAVTRRGG